MSTSLMPFDPALSPQQVNRILPIRANLLPAEITSGRNARRMRTIVIAAVVLVVVALGGWYASAEHDRSLAQHDLDTVNKAIQNANQTKLHKDLADVTSTTNRNTEISGQLKTLMAQDLSWSTLLNRLRSTGAGANVTITRVTAALTNPKDAGSNSGGLPSTTSATTVATLTIEGTGADKTTIAGFIEALGHTTGLANPYLTTATQGTGSNTAQFGFTAEADVTSVTLCGRFTTPCKTGGK
jgi:hypothetical protein